MDRALARLLVLALVGVLAFPALSAAQITRGAISGTVRDATGAVVPGASVTVTNTATNISRSAVSDARGFFRLPALEPGVYTVKAELSGFSTVEFKDVGLETASEVTINPEMKVAGVGEAITVVGRAEGIELNKTSGTIGTTTLARAVVELPLSADRNINNLIATAPNVSRVTGQGTFAANGQRSRNNNYMIDGSDNNDLSVTIATTQVVPESVAEFQVQTNAYSVEFGRNSGAQVNVITKSGTNTFRGEAWDYFRTNSLASLTNLEKDSGLTKPADYTRHQAGLSIGGPIIKDRTFFFALYQYDGDNPAASPGGTVRIPTQSGFAALAGVPLRPGQPASSRQAVLDRLSFLNDVYAANPTFRNLTTTLVNGVPIETGQTNVDIVPPSTYHTFMGRIDHHLTDSDNLTLRYYYNKRQDENAISNCAFGATFCGSQDLKDTNLALSHTHIFGPSVVNEFRFSWVQRDLLFPENDPTSPTAAISGLFTVGGLSNFPQGRVTDSYQFSNSLTWTKNRHTLKFGADVRYNKAYNQSDFNSKGNFTFNNLQDYMNNSAFNLTQALQTASWDAKQWQTFFYVQDDFRVTPDLTLNLGLRYELSDVPLGLFGATDAESLAVLVPPPPAKDTNNWAPRVGFSWSPRSSSNSILGDGKTVFRGGFGMGYDVIFYNLLTVNGSNYPRIATASINNVLDTYPNLLQAGGSPVFNPLNAWTNSAADTVNPDSKYWSFSIGREIGEFVAEVGYTGSRGGHGINQIHANPSVLTAEQAALVAATKNSNAIPSVQARRVYPQYGVRTLIPAYVGPAGNDVEATVPVQRGLRLGGQAPQPRRPVPALVHPQQVREQQRRLARRDRDRRLEPAPAEHVRLRGRVEPVAVRRAQPLRRELPLGGPRPEVGRPEANPRRVAVHRHHRVPVGATVHDRYGCRLERRRDDRFRPTEPRQRDPGLGQGAQDLHQQRLRGGTPRDQQPAARQRAGERDARPQLRAQRGLLEHRREPAEADLHRPEAADTARGRVQRVQPGRLRHSGHQHEQHGFRHQHQQLGPARHHAEREVHLVIRARPAS